MDTQPQEHDIAYTVLRMRLIYSIGQDEVDHWVSPTIKLRMREAFRGALFPLMWVQWFESAADRSGCWQQGFVDIDGNGVVHCPTCTPALVRLTKVWPGNHNGLSEALAGLRNAALNPIGIANRLRSRGIVLEAQA